jgi:hypothetical protein
MEKTMNYEWLVSTYTEKSSEHGDRTNRIATPPRPDEGWVLDRVEFKTNTLYVVPKEDWGNPRCETHVTVMEIWKRPASAEWRSGP